jgi:hypothetical protein
LMQNFLVRPINQLRKLPRRVWSLHLYTFSGTMLSNSVSH